ncbi:hypothetical protein [Nicoliella lavandulae]|uniref:Uncharacterized protein n=1 Tax=Nicoliella lavandulae TaxID=3082954 RepID=A0ABU8SIL2_9LACO
MNNFEGLHPIMTASYNLDWLTKYKVKDVETLRTNLNADQGPADSSTFVNDVMRKIMDGQQLCWGISDKAGNLIGIVAIYDLSHPAVDVHYQVASAHQASFNAAEVKTSIDSLLAGINHQIDQWVPHL